MKIGIEASNIRAGGGLTHLIELLNNSNPQKFGINEVVVWSGKKTLEKLPNFNWLKKETHSFLDKSIFHRMFWVLFLSKKAFCEKCDLLFAPGGLYSGSFPYVSMSQNMLVFEKKERARFGFSLTRLRLKLLFYSQSKSLKNAKAVVFISNYAKDYIEKLLDVNFNSTVVYHGISNRFRSLPKTFNNVKFNDKRHLNLLYVSIINEYKHQDILAQTINKMNNEGYFIKLNLVGAVYPKSLEKLKPHLSEHVKFLGKVDFEKVHEVYKDADAFIFPSTCENMPNILVEAMSAGLPIISSNYGPMPEILTNNGLYIDPLNSESIKFEIDKIYKDSELLDQLSIKAYNHSQLFDWTKCADQTFKFLSSLK